MNAIYKVIASFLVLTVVITGYFWVRTPHISPDISLKCETPDTPEQLAKLVIVREMYDDREAYFFAKRFARFSWYSGSKGGLYGHELYSGLYNLTFYGVGMTHFEFNMPYKERYTVKSLTKTQCVDKADQLIIEIKAWVEVCDKEILGYHLHFPVLDESTECLQPRQIDYLLLIDKVYLTPVEALNRLEAGSIVYEMKFGYYTDFVLPDNYSVVEYGYLINGAINGDFMGTFISAMAGNTYK